MVEMVGRLENTEVENGIVKDTWRIPALSERLARRYVHANSRVKGRSSPSIVSVEQIDKGSIPRQKIYEVKTESER